MGSIKTPLIVIFVLFGFMLLFTVCNSCETRSGSEYRSHAYPMFIPLVVPWGGGGRNIYKTPSDYRRRTGGGIGGGFTGK